MKNKKLWLSVIVGAVFVGLVILLRASPSTSGVLWQWSSGGKWLLPLVSVAALIDSINPCAFSILLLTIAFLFSVGNLRSSILKIGGVYILGIFAAYMLIGLGIFQALHIFNTPHFMAKLGSWLLIILGLINILGVFFPKFPIKLKIPDGAHGLMARLMAKVSVPTAFLLGALVGLCEFPCTGGPYLMVIGLLHDQGTYLSGLGYLIFYNLIFVAPLVILLWIGSNEKLLEKVQGWQRAERPTMRLWGGIAMIVLGLIIFLF